MQLISFIMWQLSLSSMHQLKIVSFIALKRVYWLKICVFLIKVNLWTMVDGFGQEVLLKWGLWLLISCILDHLTQLDRLGKVDRWPNFPNSHNSKLVQEKSNYSSLPLLTSTTLIGGYNKYRRNQINNFYILTKRILWRWTIELGIFHLT